jgi:hypothetical protein
MSYPDTLARLESQIAQLEDARMQEARERDQLRSEINLLRLERDAADGVTRTAAALAACALEPCADVYSGGEGFEGYQDEEKAHLTCGRVKHYGLDLGCFRRASEAFARLALLQNDRQK